MSTTCEKQSGGRTYLAYPCVELVGMDDVWVSQVDAEHGLQRLQGGVTFIPVGMQCLHHLSTHTCYSLHNSGIDKCTLASQLDLPKSRYTAGAERSCATILAGQSAVLVKLANKRIEYKQNHMKQ